MTQLEKHIEQIIKNPHKVRAKDFEKLLITHGFVMRKGDGKKLHRHYYHPDKPEQLVVILFTDGESTILSPIYVKRYLKELGLK